MTGLFYLFETSVWGLFRQKKGLLKVLRLTLSHPCLVLFPLITAQAQASPSHVQPPTLETIARLASSYGEPARGRVLSWQKLVTESGNKTEAEKVALANSFFNRMDFASDPKQWGVDDFWATPLEMLASNGGDCEDYAIAKYYTLRLLGIPVERLRITHAVDWKRDQSHMVLLYYPLVPTAHQDALVLDNRTSEILPLSKRMGLLPVYGFNNQGVWVMPKNKPPRMSSMGLAQWQALNSKMQQQGLPF